MVSSGLNGDFVCIYNKLPVISISFQHAIVGLTLGNGKFDLSLLKSNACSITPANFAYERNKSSSTMLYRL